MRTIRTAILSAAVIAGLGLAGNERLTGHHWRGNLTHAADAPDANGAAKPAEVPVRAVVLFSSGVGYFEHFGSVSGTGSTELRFKTQQINDILKSLILQDLDGGKINVITYPSQDPIAKTLRSFQVDITANPSLGELLNQLRGAKVKAVVGAEAVEGTILGLEKKQKPNGDKGITEVWVLNLLSGAMIRSVELDSVTKLELEDKQLQEELGKALLALSQARDQDKKPVTISFSGQGERHLRVGYVIETPVWKTSYRLVLSDPEVKGDGAAGRAEDAKPRAAEGAGDKGGAGKAAVGKGGNIQGWAIIENQTDNDWNEVQLSLISGRPISFIQDLYRPLYVPRPVVQPKLYASLTPQTYEGGMQAKREVDRFSDMAASAATPAPSAAAPIDSLQRARGNRRDEAAKSLSGGTLALDAKMDQKEFDPTASVASVASAAKAGELFQYTVGSVSLPRQRSAMIPIITDAIEAEKLSIYNPSVLARNPLNGARLKNTTGKHLLAGPVTVLDSSANVTSYAGDASIDDVPPGQERLLSYGIDLQVLVDATKNTSTSTIQAGKIVKGVLQLTRKNVFHQEYQAQNKGDKDKTLIVEHPLRTLWKLAQPKSEPQPYETTATLYRFRGKVAAGKATVLSVNEELIQGETIAILSSDPGTLDFYSKTGQIDKAVKDALIKAIQLKQTMLSTQRLVQEKQQQVQQIAAEQTRIRENMKSVTPQSEYYTRLLKKLNDQESKIESLQTEVEQLKATLEGQRKELEDYVGGLNVG